MELHAILMEYSGSDSAAAPGIIPTLPSKMRGERMSDEIRARHRVRGGITGLAQVCGRNNITWEQKFSYDLEYVRKITLWQDIKIMLMTIFKVLKRSDVVRDGTASDIDYGDWLMQEMAVTKEEYVRKMEEVNEWVGG